MSTENIPVQTVVWYGICGHWTDDWTKLQGVGVPRCPIDGAPGYHASPTWWADVDRYEADGHPGYRAKVMALRIP